MKKISEKKLKEARSLIASHTAITRWANKSEEDKSKHGKMMINKRWEKYRNRKEESQSVDK